MIASEPVAIVKGGQKKRIRNDRDAIFNGSDSINVDCAQGYEDCYLYYYWSCKGIKFCDGFISHDNSIVVPKKDLEGYVSVLKLTLFTFFKFVIIRVMHRRLSLN